MLRDASAKMTIMINISIYMHLTQRNISVINRKTRFYLVYIIIFVYFATSLERINIQYMKIKDRRLEAIKLIISSKEIGSQGRIAGRTEGRRFPAHSSHTEP